MRTSFILWRKTKSNAYKIQDRPYDIGKVEDYIRWQNLGAARSPEVEQKKKINNKLKLN